LFLTDIAKITQKDCREWVARHSQDYSATRLNGALGVVRRIFDFAVENGYRVDSPAKHIDRKSLGHLEFLAHGFCLAKVSRSGAEK